MLPSIEEIEARGYESLVLERVMKATPNKHVSRTHSGARSRGQPSSGSESAVREKMRNVEQAVDEVLHLRMATSIMDADKPGTMIVATGDAKEAEYSEGFLKMVERALKAGWKVEIVSFQQQLSYAYQKKELLAKWGANYRTIQLDPYIEQLFAGSIARA
jgi:hypothetical protein